jgi:hypothetical protein
VFGPAASQTMSKLLADRQIEVVTSAYCEVPRSGLVVVHPGGRTVAADRVVAFPQLVGPQVSGLPSDGGGFIPVDAYGRVRDVNRVWEQVTAPTTRSSRVGWRRSWPTPPPNRSRPSPASRPTSVRSH